MNNYLYSENNDELRNSNRLSSSKLLFGGTEGGLLMMKPRNVVSINEDEAEQEEMIHTD